jgi:hypothetical protein
MTISNELFMAILAMDSYNRGYNPGLSVDGNQIGDARLTTDSSILRDAVTQERFDFPVGFFAQAYAWNGQTVGLAPMPRR